MKFYGVCPASCGEFVQGIADKEEYLSSYAIDLYSTASVEERLRGIKKGPTKSRKAIEKIFERFNIPIKESKNISLEINSQIPVSKGMASSSADIGATIVATLGLINKNLSDEEICKLATEIEPTDSIYLKKNSIFNPLNGDVVKYLGNLKNSKVIVLEPNNILSTKKIRSTPHYNKIKLQNKEIIKESFHLLEKGLKNNDLSLVGQACTLSSLANENIHNKEFLKEIIETSKNYGAYGVNIAHSGTVIGILIDNSMNDKRLIQLLKASNIDSIYKKMYTKNIIDGGIRRELEWNTSKILCK